MIITCNESNALREVLSFFKKRIYKEKCGTVTKRKNSVKNIVINQISLEHLANILYDSFFETLILVLHYCCGDNVKYRLLSKLLF